MPVAENIIKQDFSVDAPNKLWMSDLSYIRTWEGWLYLAVVIDAFSRRVVGFSVADHMCAELCVSALEMAVQLRNPERGLIHHSDRGSQYVSEKYQSALDGIGAICSMSGRGNCYDNAAVESFFSTLKQELIYRSTWPTRRRHSTVGNISPIEYELRAMRLQMVA